MERLTKIDGCGQNDLIRCFDCGPEKAGENLENCGYCSEGWQRALNRLAAYEDTGLEPEEIKTAFNEGALLKLPAQYLGTTPDRLREWAKAEQEGRLVVLPCKVGDTVYIPVIEKRTVVRVRVQGISISVSGRAILRFGGYPIGSAWGDGCGKDWFLTREEAEAALAGERKDGEG